MSLIRSKECRSLGILLVPLLAALILSVAAPAGAGQGSEAGWKSAANARIESLRKRDVDIQIVDEQRRPVPLARVEARLVRPGFPFGAAITAQFLRNPRYQEFFKSHFNWAVFGNESKWYANERERGRTNYASADALLAWCASNNIAVRGHCLFWEPQKWQPQWVPGLASNDLRQAVEARLEGAVTHFRGRFQHWDVDNEMLHGSFFRERLGDGIRAWMFQRAHELDPNVKLFVNEFNILSVDQNFQAVQTEDYVAQIRALLDQGAPIDGIGIQGHIWKEDIASHPEWVKERLDKVAALKLPIWLTEFDVADTNEQSNADKLEVVYRTAFSHPAVEGIMTWVVWAGDSWRGPNAGLAHQDWSLNEAGRRFEVLMQEWSTNVRGETDSRGTFAFRGFTGDYEAKLTAPGRAQATHRFRLDPGEGAARTVLQLEPPPK